MYIKNDNLVIRLKKSIMAEVVEKLYRNVS